jgi:hypothetical protein
MRVLTEFVGTRKLHSGRAGFTDRNATWLLSTLSRHICVCLIYTTRVLHKYQTPCRKMKNPTASDGLCCEYSFFFSLIRRHFFRCHPSTLLLLLYVPAPIHFTGTPLAHFACIMYTGRFPPFVARSILSPSTETVIRRVGDFSRPRSLLCAASL